MNKDEVGHIHPMLSNDSQAILSEFMLCKLRQDPSKHHFLLNNRCYQSHEEHHPVLRFTCQANIANHPALNQIIGPHKVDNGFLSAVVTMCRTTGTVSCR